MDRSESGISEHSPGLFTLQIISHLMLLKIQTLIQLKFILCYLATAKNSQSINSPFQFPSPLLVHHLLFASGGAVAPAAHFKWHKAPITSVEWHPTDGSALAVAGADDQVCSTPSIRTVFVHFFVCCCFVVCHNFFGEGVKKK
jgi:WD40 repeat protein